MLTEAERQTLHQRSHPLSPCEQQDRGETGTSGSWRWDPMCPARTDEEKVREGTSSPEQEILALANTSLKPHTRRANFSGRR